MQQWTCLCGKGPGALQGNETEKGDAQTQAFLGQVNLSSDLSRIWDSHYSVLPPQGQTICSHTLGSEQVQGPWLNSLPWTNADKISNQKINA